MFSLLALLGVDGCFIKLTTGAQILAATGRDGNKNIYPLAFGIVVQEDKANWCWFLHQLKICLGGEVGQFGPYTIMSDRQKVCECIFHSLLHIYIRQYLSLLIGCTRGYSMQ